MLWTELFVPLTVFFASRNLIYSGLLYELEPKHGWSRSLRMVPYLPAKGLLNFLRTVPEILWALIFVFIVGLGPFAGVLALGVHTGGVLGKLFGEVLEDVDQQPIESLQSTGANRLQILFYGILPQVLPQFISYTHGPAESGIPLFKNGKPISDDITSQIILWDVGIEVNQEPGIGSGSGTETKSAQYRRSRERRRAQRQGCQIWQCVYESIQCDARHHQAGAGPRR